MFNAIADREQISVREQDRKDVPSTGQFLLELFDELTENIPQEVLAKLPTDSAEQHDRYIYGTPKRTQ
ncbi:MAG: hypothetical protein J7647_28395 [Cyanobacteria bacterium SBLK]|nr:hypothetical protein [Cyanobacteria bacterium SBLK]